MKNRLLIGACMALTAILFSCSNGNGDLDATGTFESEEVIVSSEAMGKLLKFDVEEGMVLKQDQV
ncbi:MAG: hypothetical protein KJO12_03635, partial [Ignavibacteria bacterium]|nr:hypothetical protein [Ignavibacteria bacterium]